MNRGRASPGRPPEDSARGGGTFQIDGRKHHLLFRPRPLLLEAHPEDFILIIGELPGRVVERISAVFIENKALRQRLALVDPGRAEKINLTRSSVFVHFERYLRRVCGLRLNPSPVFHQALVDGAILSLEMG